jgi:hypothetical protein
MSTTFADVVPIRQLTSHSYAIDLADEWCIGDGMYTAQYLDICNRFPYSLLHDRHSDIRNPKFLMAAIALRAFYSLPARTCL